MGATMPAEVLLALEVDFDMASLFFFFGVLILF